MTVRFVVEHLTPARPHGDMVEVTFHVPSQRILAASYLSDGRRVRGTSLRLLKASLADDIDMARGWENYAKEYIRVLPELGT